VLRFATSGVSARRHRASRVILPKNEANVLASRNQACPNEGADQSRGTAAYFVGRTEASRSPDRPGIAPIVFENRINESDDRSNWRRIMSLMSVSCAVVSSLVLAPVASASALDLRSAGNSSVLSAAFVYTLAIVISIGTALGIKLLGTALKNFNDSETE
jgi:hypothetical protein